MMNTSQKLLIFGLGIVAVCMLFSQIGMEENARFDPSASTAISTETNTALEFEVTEDTTEFDVVVVGTRADPPKYVSVDNCKVCHDDAYDGWKETGHGKDFTPGSGIRPAVNTYGADPEMMGSCGYCHVVGLGETENGGFDANEKWESGTPTGDQEVANVDLIGIQCESCHGPGSEHNGDPEGIIGNPSVEESCYADGDSGCHGPAGHDKYTVWYDSAHSPKDQIEADLAGEEPHGLNSYCARCKSPSQYDEDATYGNAEEIAAADWHGIGCADCHDPHSDEYEYQLRTTVEEACTVCHTNDLDEAESGSEPHHTQMEAFGGDMGIGVTGQKGMAGVTCVDCHMWQSPEVSHGYYMDMGIDGEHRESHDFEPKVEACADCHSNVLSTMPEHERPDNNTGDNEELWNEWDEFGTEWNETVEMWEMVIRDWEEDYERLFDHVEENYGAAEAALISAQENGTATPATIADAQSLLDDAIWNIGLANDGSRGIHNPDFFTDLLNYANVNANTALELLTTNGAPISNAGMSKLVETDETITFNASASSDIDGSIVEYYWDFGDGSIGTDMVVTHSYSRMGTYLVTLTVTDNMGEMDTDMISVFVITPTEEPVPVDLSDIEDEITDIKKDSDDIMEQLEKLNATLGGKDGSDSKQVTTNKDDISDIDSKISRISGSLIFVLVLILIFVLAVTYFGSIEIKKEISSTRDGILEKLEGSFASTESKEEDSSKDT
jgi:predicted CXXCH cytochrome family protein